MLLHGIVQNVSNPPHVQDPTADSLGPEADLLWRHQLARTLEQVCLLQRPGGSLILLAVQCRVYDHEDSVGNTMILIIHD